MNDADFKILTFLPKENIMGFVVYTNNMPVCAVSKELKIMLTSHFNGVPIKEVDISKGKEQEDAFGKFSNKYPLAKNLPQIVIHYESASSFKEANIDGKPELEKLCVQRERY